VTTSPDGTFTARLRTEPQPSGAASFAGRWLASGGLIVTAIVVPR
jgi:hypothetical protein